VIRSIVERTGKDIQIDAGSMAKMGASLPAIAGNITISESIQKRDTLLHFSLDRGHVLWVQEKNEIVTVMGESWEPGRLSVRKLTQKTSCLLINKILTQFNLSILYSTVLLKNNRMILY
jgi:hypothetical protein